MPGRRGRNEKKEMRKNESNEERNGERERDRDRDRETKECVGCVKFSSLMFINLTKREKGKEAERETLPRDSLARRPFF